MILDQGLPKFLWGKATMTTVYIQNRSPHRILENMTPEEEFTRKKPSVDYLQIFWSLTYIHIPKEKQKKLDSTSIKGSSLAIVSTQNHIESTSRKGDTLK